MSARYHRALQDPVDSTNKEDELRREDCGWSVLVFRSDNELATPKNDDMILVINEVQPEG